MPALKLLGLVDLHIQDLRHAGNNSLLTLARAFGK